MPNSTSVGEGWGTDLPRTPQAPPEDGLALRPQPFPVITGDLTPHTLETLEGTPYIGSRVASPSCGTGMMARILKMSLFSLSQMSFLIGLFQIMALSFYPFSPK